MSAADIRLRVVGRNWRGRRCYEVELAEGRESTEAPVFLLEKHLGVGDAWALIRAADAAWTGEIGGWVSLHDEGSTP